MNYLSIAVMTVRINSLQRGIENNDDIYKVLSVIEKQLLISEEKLERFIITLSDTNKSFNWIKDKTIIENGYCGIFGQSLDAFLDKNYGV